MGGFTHLDEAKPTAMTLDPETAERIHGKKLPKVHVETYGCQTNTKNTTTESSAS